MSHKIIFIVGPTATGKSKLALDLAKKYNGEVLNADSVQMYKEFNIGSAKPSDEELKAAPHHLIGFLDPSDRYTAGRFRKDALNILNQIKDTTPIFIVGGSGFYIQALQAGVYDIPDVPSNVKEELEKLNDSELFQKLETLDPTAAITINPNDRYRMLRALEVTVYTGVPFSQFKTNFKKEEFPYKYFQVGLTASKNYLKTIIEKRTTHMLEQGLIAETKRILQSYSDAPALGSVGYREVVSYLQNELKFEDLPAAIIQNTLLLVKKQKTWFKKSENIRWFDIETELQQAKRSVEDYLCTV